MPSSSPSHPRLQLAFGYIWKQADFPWMGIWEENHSRAAAAVERADPRPAGWNSASLPFPNRGAR